jgi:RNA polymerase sigma-70 factor, ECF subfamily
MRGDDRRRNRDDDLQVVGTPGLFEEFYAKEVKAVLALALGLTRRRWEAEDVTQEAFYRAFRDWDRVGHMNHPGAWVRRVALNLAVGRWRRMRAEARAALRLGIPASSEPPDPVSVRFWGAVRALPPRQAQVVALTYVDDLDSEAVGAVLGISPATVRVHLARARATLAERLELEQ